MFYLDPHLTERHKPECGKIKNIHFGKIRRQKAYKQSHIYVLDVIKLFTLRYHKLYYLIYAYYAYSSQFMLLYDCFLA